LFFEEGEVSKTAEGYVQFEVKSLKPAVDTRTGKTKQTRAVYIFETPTKTVFYQYETPEGGVEKQAMTIIYEKQ
jgi:hypothetical protein